LLINGVKIPLNEAKNIKLNIAIRSIKRGGYLLSNRIELTDSNNQIYKTRFVINSRDHDREFQKIIDQWQANGVIFDLSYHGV